MPTTLISTDGVHGRSAPCVALLEKAGFEVRFSPDKRLARGQCSVQETRDLLHDVEAVIAWAEPYSREVLNELPNLRVIARSGVGFELVDVPAATEKGVVLTITPTANYEAVAEHTMALLLALARFIVQQDQTTRQGLWNGYTLIQLRGKTLGIVGLGRIGRAVASRAKAMQMNVIATEQYPDEEFVQQHGLRLVPLGELLATSDFVSLHCPLSEQTQGIIQRKTLAQMKPGAMLINTSRGGLVVEDDLLESLRRGHLLGAGLDVFQQEPPDAANPLFQLDNVVLSPHIAGNDTLAVTNMGLEAAQCIIDLSQGRWPEQAVVNQELQGRWKW